MTVQNAQGERVAVVTGASCGIGHATAQALAGAGWNLVLLARADYGTSASGLSRRLIPRHSGSVLDPRPDGDAVHGSWGRFGQRTEQRALPRASR